MDRTTWLVGLADVITSETGVIVDPMERFGLSARLVASHRRLIEEGGLLEEGVDLGQRLTDLGRESGAMERARSAELARREGASARTESLMAVRAERSVGRTVLDQALKESGPIPAPDAELADQSAWAAALNSDLAQVDETIRPVVRHALRAKMLRTGWPTDKSGRVAERILAMPRNMAA